MHHAVGVLRGEVIRVKNLGRVDIIKLDSKVARCHCSGVYLNVVFDRLVVAVALRYGCMN
jgi:hypothetical protein